MTPARPASDQEEARRQRVLGSMPPEPDELAELRRVSPIVAAAVEAIRVEYGALALRNARLIRRLGRWLFAGLGALALVLIALGLESVNLSGQQANTLTALQQSRHTSLGVTCATESAIAEAGRRILLASSDPATTDAFLALFHLPPLTPAQVAAQQQRAEQQADQYVRGIARAIHDQVGKRGDDLVLKGGRLNCRRLAQIARLPGS